MEDDKDPKSNLKWETVPQPPIAGPYYIDMIPEFNLKAHDSSIDDKFCSIHTPFTDFFPIDYLEEIRSHFESGSSESWLRQSTQIDVDYYRNQSERMGSIRRDEDNDYIEDVFDYQVYVDESFAKVNQDVMGYEVVEEYPLFPSFTEQYILANGDFKNSESFKNLEGGSTLIDKCLIGNVEYECIKQSCTDNIIVEIKDSRAYYSIAPFILKFKEIEK